MTLHHRAYLRLWLSSLGYSVQQAPDEVLEAYLLRESRQWRIAPEQLEQMVAKSYATDQRLVWTPLASLGLMLWKPLAAQGAAQAA